MRTNWVGALGLSILCTAAAHAGDCVYYADYLDDGGSLEPPILGELELPDSDDSFRELQVEGARAYVATLELGLAVVDISDPTDPILRGNVFLPIIREMHVVEPIAFVVHVDGLSVVDVSDAANPTIIGNSGEVDELQDIQVVGDLAYVADLAGVLVADVTDLTLPVPVKHTLPVYFLPAQHLIK